MRYEVLEQTIFAINISEKELIFLHTFASWRRIELSLEVKIIQVSHATTQTPGKTPPKWFQVSVTLFKIPATDSTSKKERFLRYSQIYPPFHVL